MTRNRYDILIAFVISCLALWILTGRAHASAPDAADVVRGFYGMLQDTMRDGRTLGPSGRFQKLDPTVRKTFDVALMTRLAVGPSWSTLSSEQQQQLTSAFERYVAATYADRFDSYSGERLEVIGQQPRGDDVIVLTRIVKTLGVRVDPAGSRHRRADNRIEPEI